MRLKETKNRYQHGSNYICLFKEGCQIKNRLPGCQFKLEFQIKTNSAHKIQCLGQAYTKILFVGFLKLEFSRYLAFLFLKAGGLNLKEQDAS